MDRFLKTERLDVDPSSATSSEQWKHWLVTFRNFLAALPQVNLDNEPLPDDVDHLCVKEKQELQELLLINRVELHAFCDASELAYVAVIYLLVETSASLALVSLVTAKNRLAPIKRLRLP
ncbi:hypothetical protein T03_15960 [Trichinella britovi]|uniref:Uncharacterized protein n=1 Tax=Trichinella britovi TaxID=45882 RepID=A0A0V1CIX3_TRIBR|nr:hypothetical protein T03_15960 [Trichinella britovi]